MTGSTDYILSKLKQEADTLPDSGKEITQHLVELGYMPSYALAHINQKEISKACREFFNDVISSDLFSSREKSEFKNQGQDTLVPKLLRKLTDIDDEISIPSFPENNSLNLTSRLIHYRLQLFGYWEQPIESKFNSIASFPSIQGISKILKCTNLETINLMGNIDGFTKKILATKANEDFIVTFYNGKINNDIAKKYDRRQAFKRQLADDFGEKSEAFTAFRKHVLVLNDKNINYNFLLKESKSELNVLVMRLMQINLWQDGFYNGLLDGNIGEITLESLVDAVSFYNATNNKHIKTHRVVTYIEQGYFLFNALFFLREYMRESDNSSRESSKNYLNTITQQFETSKEQDRIAFINSFNKLKTEIKKESTEPVAIKNGIVRRIYYGAKRILIKLKKASRKIFKWITDQAKKAWSFLKKAFTNLFEDLKAGIRYFMDGISFLIGQKAIVSNNNNGLITTFFSIDGDSVCIANNSASGLVTEHIKKLSYSTSTIRFSLSIVGGVLQVITKSLNILSWPTLLFTIINTYKNISKSFNNIQL